MKISSVHSAKDLSWDENTHVKNRKEIALTRSLSRAHARSSFQLPVVLSGRWDNASVYSDEWDLWHENNWPTPRASRTFSHFSLHWGESHARLTPALLSCDGFVLTRERGWVGIKNETHAATCSACGFSSFPEIPLNGINSFVNSCSDLVFLLGQAHLFFPG